MYSLRRVLVLLGIVACLAGCSIVPSAQQSSQYDTIFASYQFPSYAGLTYLCQQRVYAQGGAEITWDAFASDVAPSTIAEYYQQKLGDTGLSKDSGQWIWRLPVANTTQNRILTVAPVNDEPLHTKCDKKPAPSAQSIILLTRG